MSYLTGAGTTRATPQKERIPGRADQVPNSEGGYVFKIDPEAALTRFLILGTEGGSYYASQADLTKQNLAAVRAAFDTLGVRAVEILTEISVKGRAPKQDPTIYALAMAAGHKDPEVRKAALDAVPEVLRTGTMLFQFLGFVKEFRGWGRSLKRTVGEWYTEQDLAKVAYQAVKYRDRAGYTHRDALRLSKPIPPTPVHDTLFEWITGKLEDDFFSPDDNGKWMGDVDPKGEFYPLIVIEAYERAQRAATPAETVKLIDTYKGLLPREALRTEHLNDREVNEALVLNGMPITAMLRNLANLTRYGAIGPMGKGVTGEVIERITDGDVLRKGRVHPMQVLFAAATYASGQSLRGSNTWTPVAEINTALNEAFYLAFENIEPSGKRTLLGIDVSGSMSQAIANSNLSCAMGAAAMAMVTEKAEPWTATMGFHNGMIDLAITHKQNILDVGARICGINYGGTDCSLPMKYALAHGLDVDTFVVYTDNETHSGRYGHASQALVEYREKTGIPARLAVVGMAANPFSIADPTDAGMLDFVGFDTAAPAVLADFSAGRL